MNAPHHPPADEPPGPATDRGRPPVGRGLLPGALVVAALTAVGFPLGLLWSWLAPEVPVVMTETGAVLAEPQPEQFAAADAWFVLLGLVLGVLAALLVWRWVPRGRGPIGLVAVGLGCVGAGLVGWRFGVWLGDTAGYERLLDTAAVGERFGRPPSLRVARAEMLVPAFAAAATYTLLAGWSRYPSLRAEPVPDAAGAGADLAPPDQPPAGRAADAPNHAGDPDHRGDTAGGFSWDAPVRPAPTAAPAPPGPGAAGRTPD